MSKKNHDIIGICLDPDVLKELGTPDPDFASDLLQELIVNDAKELACEVHLGYADAEVFSSQIR